MPGDGSVTVVGGMRDCAHAKPIQLTMKRTPIGFAAEYLPFDKSLPSVFFPQGRAVLCDTSTESRAESSVVISSNSVVNSPTAAGSTLSSFEIEEKWLSFTTLLKR